MQNSTLKLIISFVEEALRRTENVKPFEIIAKLLDALSIGKITYS